MSIVKLSELNRESINKIGDAIQVKIDEHGTISIYNINADVEGSVFGNIKGNVYSVGGTVMGSVGMHVGGWVYGSVRGSVLNNVFSSNLDDDFDLKVNAEGKSFGSISGKNLGGNDEL